MSPAVEMISNNICEEYLNKFNNWSNNGVTQESYININLKSNFDTIALRVYWLCRGTIYVKDTRYASPRNGCLYRAEFSGKPEFQISYFDLEKIKLCNELAKRDMNFIKSKLDELDNKLINQQLEELLLNGFDF